MTAFLINEYMFSLHKSSLYGSGSKEASVYQTKQKKTKTPQFWSLDLSFVLRSRDKEFVFSNMFYIFWSQI